MENRSSLPEPPWVTERNQAGNATTDWISDIVEKLGCPARACVSGQRLFRISSIHREKFLMESLDGEAAVDQDVFTSADEAMQIASMTKG